MKCDVVFTRARKSKETENKGKIKQLRGRGFKDDREYLAFLLKQEQIWEQKHLDKNNKTNKAD